jgi:hypothetical protein
VHEKVGDVVGAAGDERRRQVLVGVDTRAGNDLEPGLLRHALHQAHIAAEVHARGLDDGLDAPLDCGAHELRSDVLRILGGDVRDRFLSHRAHLRKLDEDCLVA